VVWTIENDQVDTSLGALFVNNKSGGTNAYAEIRINGEFVVNKQNSKRGINLVVLNGPDHKLILNESYNTFTA
jgi:hypothetical protein